MQRTPNLGLPQFEPTDKYRLEDYNEAYTKIDEKIKELDDKEAQLDTKLAEAQNIIDTWTQFKNNGGEVGGAIISKSYVKSNENFCSTGTNDVGLISGASGIKYSSTTKLLYPTEQDTIDLGSSYWRWKTLYAASVGIDDNSSNDESRIKTTKPKLALGANEKGIILDLKEEMSVRPWSAQKDTFTLGTYGVRFKDLYLSGSSVSANGYTKLPNGLIMQWGTWTNTPTTTSNSTTFTINFPTSFPSACIHVQPYASAFATSGNWAPQSCASAISDYSASNFKFKFGTTANIKNELKWIAIGY